MTKDRRPAVTIIVLLAVFIGAGLTLHPPLWLQVPIAAVCAAVAWVVTPKPRPKA